MKSSSFESYAEGLPKTGSNEAYLVGLTAIASLYGEGSRFLPAEPVVRSSDDSTMFTTSGVQAYTEPLSKGVSTEEMGPAFFSQPVIRMNHLSGVEPGSYTSFLNFGAMRFGDSSAEHCDTTGKYLGILSDVSSNMGLGEVVQGEPQEYQHQYNGMELESTVEGFSVDGLDVGDSILHRIIVPSIGSIMLSEVGGGFERLVHGRSTRALSSTVGMLCTPSNVVCLDAIRTMTLMAANGVECSNNNQGYQMRKAGKKVAVGDIEMDEIMRDVVPATYRYWQQQRSVGVDIETAVASVQNELWRAVNLAALEAANRKSKQQMNLSMHPDEFRAKYQL